MVHRFPVTALRHDGLIPGLAPAVLGRSQPPVLPRFPPALTASPSHGLGSRPGSLLSPPGGPPSPLPPALLQRHRGPSPTAAIGPVSDPVSAQSPTRSRPSLGPVSARLQAVSRPSPASLSTGLRISLITFRPGEPFVIGERMDVISLIFLFLQVLF